MKDLVLRGFVKSFAQSWNLPEDNIAEIFEAFSISVVLRKYHSCETSDLMEVMTGGEQMAGLTERGLRG